MWVEHPIYTQVDFALDRVFELAPQHPDWKTIEPFKSVLARDKAAMAKFSMEDLETIVAATHSGMTTRSVYNDRRRLDRESDGSPLAPPIHRTRL